MAGVLAGSRGGAGSGIWFTGGNAEQTGTCGSPGLIAGDELHGGGRGAQKVLRTDPHAASPAMKIRTFQPGDEAVQAEIYNEAAAALPKFKPATSPEVQRRTRAGDFDP